MAERSRWHPVSLAEWALLASVFRLFALAPASWAYALGEGAARLAYALDGRHRRIAEDNLTQALGGELAKGQVAALARAVFANLGRTVVDVARSGRLLQSGALAGSRVQGMDRLLAARGRGKGVLIITAHFGPWELLPLMAALRYEPIHVVARPMDNPWVDDLLTRMRERGGNRVIRKRDALPAILKVLRQGQTVGILIDQHVTERDGVVVPFFGLPASTVSAPALLALRSGAAVLPAGILREGREQFCVRIGEEVPLERTGDLKTDIVRNTARFTAALEHLIRLRLDHWFWVHRRWKTDKGIDERLREVVE